MKYNPNEHCKYVNTFFNHSNYFRWKKVGEIIDLNCFPLKSCAPIKRNSFDCHVLGIEYEDLFDRCFVVAQNNKQLTARTYPKMVLIQPEIVGNELKLSTPDGLSFVLDLKELKKNPATEDVELWTSKVSGIDAGDEVADWLSEYIVGKKGVLRLIFYPYVYPTKKKPEVDNKYQAYEDNDVGTFHDETSYMLINQASVDELNTHLDHVVKPLQFRPNIVIKGPGAYEEDSWKWIRFGDRVVFRALKPCQR